MSKYIRIGAIWLLICMIVALSVTCNETSPSAVAGKGVNLDTLCKGHCDEVLGKPCADKIISCGFDSTCPYPGQHIDVLTTGDSSCSTDVCICRCLPPATSISTGCPILSPGPEAIAAIEAQPIKILIALIFLVILMGGVSIIYVGVKAAHQVEKRGLRSVVGEVWDGKGTQ